MKQPPFPLEPHELFRWQMRIPRELEEEYAAAQGHSPWQPIPESKVLTVIGDGLELLPGYTSPVKGAGKSALDDGTIAIVGAEQIVKFCEWYWGRLQ